MSTAKMMEWVIAGEDATIVAERMRILPIIASILTPTKPILVNTKMAHPLLRYIHSQCSHN